MLALAENGVSEVLFTLRIFARNNNPRHYLPQYVWQHLGRLDSLGFHIIVGFGEGVLYEGRDSASLRSR